MSHRLPPALAAAALLGAASGVRTFAAPAALALDGRLTGDGRVRAAIAALALGEAAADKTPAIPPRTWPPALAGRAAAGAFAGHVVAGGPGAALAAWVAVLTAAGATKARGALDDRLAIPDAAVGAAEDVLVAGACAVAVALG